MVGLLQAPPGTQLYERLKQESRLLDRLSGDNVDGTTNIIPKMDLDTLREEYKSIMRHIYSPDHYYQRVKVFLREYKLPKVKTPQGAVLALPCPKSEPVLEVGNVRTPRPNNDPSFAPPRSPTVPATASQGNAKGRPTDTPPSSPRQHRQR